MSKKCLTFLPLIMGFAVVFSRANYAQSVVNPVFNNNSIVISIADNFKPIDPTILANSYLFFEDSNFTPVKIWADANVLVSIGVPSGVLLNNFRIGKDAASEKVNLATGGGGVPATPIGKSRTYQIILKGVQLATDSKMRDKQIALDVVSPEKPLAQLFIAPISNIQTVEYNRRALVVRPLGFNNKTLLEKLQANPGQIKIAYKFHANDPAIDYVTQATKIVSNPKDSIPGTTFIIAPQRALPRRPEKYTVKLSFPVEVAKDSLAGNSTVPADSPTFDVTSVADLVPGKTDRATSKFYFETTFASTVNTTTRKRTNVGIFGVHLKPTLNMLTYNVDGEQGSKPIWMAFRPLLEADFDTQSPAKLKSPNRIVFGMDYELGRDANSSSSPLQQMIWINGLRYDSDRDFKLQTMYWHTEFSPRFLNFEQTREQRLHQFRQSLAKLNDVKRKEPIISAYRVLPSIGYELGGVTKRDKRNTNFPTNHISRLLVGLDLGLEFKRLVAFSINDTYYFLENAPRRRNRNYLETRFDINTGPLFNLDLGGLQNAITFKFQRGDQPPVFGPVNAFSAGFKIFR